MSQTRCVRLEQKSEILVLHVKQDEHKQLRLVNTFLESLHIKTH